jgi:hypothetical protein
MRGRTLYESLPTNVRETPWESLPQWRRDYYDNVAAIPSGMVDDDSAPPSAAPSLADRLEAAAMKSGREVRSSSHDTLMELARRAAAALRAAEADTARLDWLERTAKAQGEVRIGYTEAWSESGDYGSVLSEGPEEFWVSDETNGNADPTLRAAIDAARKEAGNATE